jgi:hypothetical protein
MSVERGKKKNRENVCRIKLIERCEDKEIVRKKTLYNAKVLEVNTFFSIFLLLFSQVKAGNNRKTRVYVYTYRGP